MVDRSNGYEGVATEFIRVRSATIGVTRVRDWATALPRGSAVVDLGCGPGIPLTEVMVAEGLQVYAVDAAPSLVRAFRRNLPGTPVVCEAVQDSGFFGRDFDGVLAWGLMFLLSAEDQRRLIQRIAGVLVPGGRLLFTSSAETASGNDALTGLAARSLGAREYRQLLAAVGISVVEEYEDEGGNHYFDAVKAPAGIGKG
ncbi:Putative methyltransferase [Mycobacteroides abscessus subsp. abscessus]|uniref:Methyltransferase n=2 Tax=Mycobacteroides abscessus TaxID=36809 RepID=A0AB38D1N6_9MYCO|nr:putative methyltransferase [Mycobacteroides abscessus M94]MBE5421816.1 hypothetical protein [Mycobacteroides abscessus]RWU58382.1 class I SAM-dependent methyltransferase [Mycobacteroides abscessus subsp. abscessus]MBE5435548.1 hypothetical protein [Mycobacteroides abscessus]MBE5440836.1 hypothetical protein [Mycobacteroides abscessus]